MNVLRTTIILMLAASAIGFASCMFGTKTTDVRGQVMFEGKPVTNTEIRMSADGKEVVGETNYDGRYTLSLEHLAAKNIEIKVLKVGFIHDPIEFPGQTSSNKVIDIQLKRVHAPGTTAPSPNPSPSPTR
jgi:hypothetical protein